MTSYFVGREQELGVLVRSLERSVEGEGRFIAMSGEAGIGKTRLMSEIARLADVSGHLVLWSQMTEDPAAPPYLAWLLALRECFGTYSDACLREDLGDGAADLGDMVPELRQRLRLPPGRPPQNGDAARYQLLDSVSRFLAAAARRRPFLLLFDNLHLVDPSSLALLEYYVRGIRTSPVVIIGAYRSSLVGSSSPLKSSLDRLAPTVGFDHLELRGLPRDAVAELLHKRLGHPLPPATVDGVQSQSDGNALFVCEVGSMLAGRNGSLHEPEPWHRFRVPETLRGLIETRLEALPNPCIRLLAVASVLGRQFDAAALGAVMGMDLTAVLSVLERAESAGLVMATAPACFRFRHALFREVLYARHSSLQRATLHRRAAEYLETRSGGDVSAHLSQLAHHYFESAHVDRADRAVLHCVRAGEAALEQRAFTEAAKQFERALQILDVMDDADLRQQFELRLQLGDAEFRSGQIEAASETFLKAALLANHHRWWHLLCQALIRFQHVRGNFGIAHVAAVPLHEAALAHIPPKDIKLRARVLGSLAVALTQVGRRERARGTARRAIAFARESGNTSTLAYCLAAADWPFGDTTNAAERLLIARESLALAESLGSNEALMESLKSLIAPLCDMGQLDEVQHQLARLWSIAKAERHPHYLNMAAGIDTALAIVKGQWDRAVEQAVDSLRNAPLQGVVGLEGRFGFQMFAIHRSRGTLRDVAPIFQHIVGTMECSRIWLPGQILMHCELGQKDQARAALARLGDLESLPRDDLYLTVLVYLAEASASLGDRRRCGQLFKLLLPFHGLNACLYATLLHGAVAGYLAPLAVTLGQRRQARTLFEEALEMNSAMGATVPLVCSRVSYGEFLRTSEDTHDRNRATELLAAAKGAAESLHLQPMLERIASIEAKRCDAANLTRRELGVLTLIADGASNRRIAETLFVSHSTVATHVRSILRKIGAANRTEAAAFARRRRLMPVE